MSDSDLICSMEKCTRPAPWLIGEKRLCPQHAVQLITINTTCSICKKHPATFNTMWLFVCDKCG